MKITSKHDPQLLKAKAKAQAQFSRLLQIATGAQPARRPGTEVLPRSAEELLHELEVHQIELEMQNEELRRAQIELEKSRDRYVDFYDFAPVGYLTLNQEGMIDEINLTGAALLGVERSKLLHRRFAPFVAHADRDRWHHHFLAVLKIDNKINCELALSHGDGESFFAQLDCLRLKRDDKKSVVRIVFTDITRRKQVELELQKFKNIVEFSGDAIISKSPTGIIESWNYGAEKMFGYTATEAIGKLMHKLVPPNRLEEESEILSRISRGERVEPFEAVCQCKEGRLINISTTLSPIYDIQGRVVSVSVIARDITNRKRAEEAQQETLNLLQKIASQVPGVVFQLRMRPDGTSCVPYANEALREIYRLGPEDIREDACKAFAHIHPDDLENHMASIHASARDMTPWQQEYRLKFDDGTVRWLFGNALPQREADGSVLWHGFITDITERKQTEERLRQSEVERVKAEEELQRFFNLIPDMVCIASSDGHFLKINSMWQEVLGYTEQEILAIPFLDFIHPDDREATMKEVERQLAGKSTSWLINRYRRKDGSYRWLEWKATPAVDGKLLFASARDITERRQVEEKLRESESRYRSLFENMLNGLAYCRMQYDEHGQPVDCVYLDVNEAFRRLTGLKNVVGKPVSEVIPGIRELSPELFEIYGRVAATGVPETFEFYFKSQNKWLTISVYSPEPGSFVAVFEDITERKRVEEILRIAAITFESQEAIMITDADSNIIRVNHAFSDITGYTPEEVLGKNPRMMKSERQDKAFYETMWQQLIHTGSWSGEIWDKRKNGQVYPKWLNITAVKNERDETTQYVAIFSDITERKLAEEEIRKLAFYDALTKLPNRRLLLDRLRAALLHSSRNNNYGAILFIDLDRFKTLNDTLGHNCGDLLLIEVASRIKSCVREMDTVSRFGGDEFVVLIEDVSDDLNDASYKVGLVAEKIRESLAHPYHLMEHVHHSSPSIGVSLYRGNEETMDVLLQHADMAMYQAKNAGRNAVRFFDIAMQQNVSAHTGLVNDLRCAIERQQLYLYYQIQVDNENHPVGAEALLRWIHPQRGLVMPEQFIPVAEESALIHDIGDWVLETACQQLALWGEHKKMRDLTLAVNISAKQLAMPDFVGKVASLLERHQINPPRLKLELTENMVLDDQAGTVAKMHALKALGVSLSMDGFGTRYSSLSYLKQLPIDQLKIDHDFVQAITRKGEDAQLVKSIIDLANNFSLHVIAEGVETDEQLTLLKHRDCIAYQGFLFSKAVSVEEFEKLMGEVREPYPAPNLH